MVVAALRRATPLTEQAEVALVGTGPVAVLRTMLPEWPVQMVVWLAPVVVVAAGLATQTQPLAVAVEAAEARARTLVLLLARAAMQYLAVQAVVAAEQLTKALLHTAAATAAEPILQGAREGIQPVL
jgi:ABC-type branched-subunit amino acid transport system substrate-binding protein